MDLLALFQSLFTIDARLPGATVAGGYLRDHFLGVPFRDIDIAVSTGSHDLSNLGFEPDMEAMSKAEYEHDYISQVWNDGILNVIEYSAHVSPQSLNEYVDIGLCKIAWSKREGLIMDPRFTQDVADKTLTIYRTGWGEEGVANHMARLKLKYPDYEEKVHDPRST